MTKLTVATRNFAKVPKKLFKVGNVTTTPTKQAAAPFSNVTYLAANRQLWALQLYNGIAVQSTYPFLIGFLCHCFVTCLSQVIYAASALPD